MALGFGFTAAASVTILWTGFGWISVFSFLGVFVIAHWLLWSKRHSLMKRFWVKPHIAAGIVRRVLQEEGLSFKQDGSKFLIDSPEMQVRIQAPMRDMQLDYYPPRPPTRVMIGLEIERDLIFVNRLQECFDEAFAEYEAPI